MSAEEPPVWISEAEAVRVLDMGAAVAALAAGLMQEAAGTARNLVKTHVQWDGATLHAIGAVFEEAGFAGTKTWAHTSGGATPLLVLFDSRSGALKAVIEAFALGQLRTGGISGLATKYLAKEDADELAIVGAGKQALPQVAAVGAVRPLRRVRVFSPTKKRREAFADKLREKFDFEVVAAGSVAEATEGAPIVTLATRAIEPFLKAAHLSKGAHVNAVGAITPERVELDRDVFARASRLAADSVESVRKLSREFREQLGGDDSNWQRVEPLCRVVAGGRTRRSGDDVTLFKAMGMGISDLSLGMEIFRRCREAGLGHKFPHPERAEIRF